MGEKIKNFCIALDKFGNKKITGAFSLVTLGLLFLGLTVWGFYGHIADNRTEDYTSFNFIPSESVSPEVNTENNAVNKTPEKNNRSADKIAVSVVGNVKKPGFYWVSSTARVNDLLNKAGGVLHTSDLFSVNLARKLQDGEQVVVSNSNPNSTVSSTVGGPKESSASSSLINLNTATKEQLMELPGIGEATAGKILDWKKANGNFTSTEQLMEVKGIGTSKFQKIAERITV